MGVEMRRPGQNPLEDRLLKLFGEAGIRGGATMVLAQLVATATAEAVGEQNDPGKQLTVWFKAVEHRLPDLRNRFATPSG